MTLGRPTYTHDTAMDLVVDALDADQHECPEFSDCDHPDHPDHDEELAR